MPARAIKVHFSESVKRKNLLPASAIGVSFDENPKAKPYEFQCKLFKESIVIRQIWNTRFGREIVLVLLLKIVLIFAIWWAYFRTAEVPDAEQVSRALLTSVNQQGVNANDQH